MKYLEMILPFFPTASIYKKNELIVEPKNNVYFRIDNINSQLEFECKILEYVSRSCIKGVSLYWQRYFLCGVNSFFRKNWNKSEMELIYTRLGNGVNRQLCIDFIQSAFNNKLLGE